MTLTVPTSVELADSPCSVAECLETAQLMGSATVRVNPGVGAPPDFETLTVGLPLWNVERVQPRRSRWAWSTHSGRPTRDACWAVPGGNRTPKGVGGHPRALLAFCHV